MIENFEGGGKLIRMMTDANQDIFRYGLHKYGDSEHEDPTYLGFTLEIDQETLGAPVFEVTVNNNVGETMIPKLQNQNLFDQNRYLYNG